MDVAAFLCSRVSAVLVHTVYPYSHLISYVTEKSPSRVLRLLGKTQEYDPVGVKPAMLCPHGQSFFQEPKVRLRLCMCNVSCACKENRRQRKSYNQRTLFSR